MIDLEIQVIGPYFYANLILILKIKFREFIIIQGKGPVLGGNTSWQLPQLLDLLANRGRFVLRPEAEQRLAYGGSQRASGEDCPAG